MSKIEILDGAMGSELISLGEKLPPYIWSAESNTKNPSLVYEIHRSYIEKGADYITTNTFRTTPRSYEKIGLSQLQAQKTSKQSFDSALIQAKKASQGKIKILGSIAPLEDCYSPHLFPGVEIAKNEYNKIGEWFIEYDIDIFLLETMNNITETKACIEAIQSFGRPIWVSYNLKDSSTLLSGESLEEAIKVTKSYPVECLLLNCNPLKRTIKAMSLIKKKWARKWGIYPNLGIGEPSPDGRIEDYHEDLEFLDLVNNSIKFGVNFIGGCCGSSPRHIALLKNNII